MAISFKNIKERLGGGDNPDSLRRTGNQLLSIGQHGMATNNPLAAFAGNFLGNTRLNKADTQERLLKEEQRAELQEFSATAFGLLKSGLSPEDTQLEFKKMAMGILQNPELVQSPAGQSMLKVLDMAATENEKIIAESTDGFISKQKNLSAKEAYFRGDELTPEQTKRLQAQGIIKEDSADADTKLRDQALKIGIDPSNYETEKELASAVATRNDQDRIEKANKEKKDKGLTPKELQTAKTKIAKLTDVKANLTDLKNIFKEMQSGLFSGVGPVQGMIPTPLGEKFDNAVDIMRDSVTALTRVPGVGAMSDFETRLATAKFPERAEKFNASSIEDQIFRLERFINNIESGYTGLLSDDPSNLEDPTGNSGLIKIRDPQGIIREIPIELKDKALQAGGQLVG